MESLTNNQPTKRQRAKILKRLKNVGYNQRTFSKEILHKKPQQLTQALNGEQPGLYKKLLFELEQLEAKQA